MMPSDKEQDRNKSRDAENERTVILVRCLKHHLAYMPSEGCPECRKEKIEAGEGAAK